MNSAKLFKVMFILSAVLTGINCGGTTQSSEAPVGETVSATALIAQADNLYKQRDDLSKLRNALQLLRRARVADGNNFEAAWKLSKFNYFMGSNAKDEELRDRSFKDGVTAGKSAIKIDPEKADGYFWVGANLGGQAQVNLLDGAANLPEIRENMEKVIQIQPDYEAGMAYVALSQTELETRGMMGGSAEKAVEYLQEALKISKQNSFTYLYLAEAYLDLNRKPEARKTLDAMRNIPPNPDYLPERREAEEKAKRLEARF